MATAILNSLLAALPRKSYLRLLRGLAPVDLVFGEVLYEAGDQIQDVYFPSRSSGRAGPSERNRALTIIKSRGTWHSNQVRELVLGSTGPALADVYTAGGEVLMGTLRWEKEDQERGKALQRRAAFDHKRRELRVSEADTTARIKALQQDLARQRAELAMSSSDNQARIVSSSDREKELRRIRSADSARPGANGSGNSSKGNGKSSRDAP